MDRIVEIKVNGNYLTKDNKNAGVRGEGNVTNMRITFDEGWDRYDSGVSANLYMKYLQGIGEAESDGKLEKTEVVDVITGLNVDDDTAWALYTSEYDGKATLEAKEHGIDAELFMTATVDMGNIKADYNSNGKVIQGSRRAKVERYLNSVCSSYKEYLFLLGTEYDSVKDDYDYVKYFGE